jgi:hypothetical protein
MSKYEQVVKLYLKGYTDEEIVEITGLPLANVCEAIGENFD